MAAQLKIFTPFGVETNYEECAAVLGVTVKGVTSMAWKEGGLDMLLKKRGIKNAEQLREAIARTKTEIGKEEAAVDAIMDIFKDNIAPTKDDTQECHDEVNHMTEEKSVKREKWQEELSVLNDLIENVCNAMDEIGDLDLIVFKHILEDLVGLRMDNFGQYARIDWKELAKGEAE